MRTPDVELEAFLDALQVPDWHRDAACLEHPELDWFPERGQNASRQKSVCSTCPARDDCRAFAVAERIQHGIWGGESERERRRARVPLRELEKAS